MSSPTLLPFDSLRAKGITLSRVQVWRLEKQNRFPKRRQVSPGRVAWLDSEIDEFIRTRPIVSSHPKAA